MSEDMIWLIDAEVEKVLKRRMNWEHVKGWQRSYCARWYRDEGGVVLLGEGQEKP
jgi:hypothetical protein